MGEPLLWELVILRTRSRVLIMLLKLIFNKELDLI